MIRGGFLSAAAFATHFQRFSAVSHGTPSTTETSGFGHLLATNCWSSVRPLHGQWPGICMASLSQSASAVCGSHFQLRRSCSGGMWKPSRRDGAAHPITGLEESSSAVGAVAFRDGTPQVGGRPRLIDLTALRQHGAHDSTWMPKGSRCQTTLAGVE